MTTQVPDPKRCPFCPDGHRDPRSRNWGVYVGPERDGDGQPTTLHVRISDGAHVAESDAHWLWELIRDRRGNHVTGTVHGSVVQAGNIAGGVSL